MEDAKAVCLVENCRSAVTSNNGALADTALITMNLIAGVEEQNGEYCLPLRKNCD